MQIYDGRDSFYQWDLNQKITSDSFKVGEEIHFFNMKQEKALPVLTYESEGNVVADVPNILLQNSYPITAYRYIETEDASFTIEQETFEVKQRPKPSDYIYTETEILTIEAMVDAAVTEAKESGEFNGEPGKDGKDGKDGIDGVDGKDGADGKDGYTPQKGVDYYTEADKSEMVNAVLEALPNGDEVSY